MGVYVWEMVFGSGCLKVLDNTIPTQDIGCSGEVAREWLFKLRDRITTMPRENIEMVWVRKK